MQKNPPTVILSAPAAWGKTRHAEQLRAEFGCSGVVDNWSPRLPMTPGALHLTNVPAADVSGQVASQSVRLVERGW